MAGGSDLGLFEINEAAALVAEAVHPEANIIFGATIDDALGDEVRITVIAAGFDGGLPKKREEGSVLGRPARPQQTQEEMRAAVAAVATRRAEEREVTPERSAAPVQQEQPAPAPAPTPAQPMKFDDDDLDVHRRLGSV